jgi:hypothetical protein
MRPESFALFIPVRRSSINCRAWSIVIKQVTRNFVSSKSPMFTAIGDLAVGYARTLTLSVS